MQFRNKFLFVFVLLLLSQSLFSQKKEEKHPKADSIRAVIDKMPRDTARLRMINKLYLEYSLFNSEKAMSAAEELLAEAEELRDTNWIAVSYDNIARVHWMNEDPPQALFFLQKKLALCEMRHDLTGVANCYNNMGAVYRGTKNLDKALENFQKSHEIRIKLHDTIGMGSSLANIGMIYDMRGDMRTGLTYYFQSRKMREKQKDIMNLAVVYTNIGSAYIKLRVIDSALIALDSALLLYRQLGDLRGLASNYQNMGSALYALKQYPESKAYEDSAIVFGRKSGKLEVVLNAYGELSKIEEELGNFQEALHWQVRKFELYDTLYNTNMSGQVAEMEAKYQSEKKQRENDQLKADAARNAVINNFLYALAGLGLIIAGVLFYAYRNKRKSNRALAKQNKQIESQKKEITDSITYAQRIQQAILPAADTLQNEFAESFALYKPKAIVSGDFWWTQTHNGKLIIAVGDCTGHGVPGAFMSMLGVDKLTTLAPFSVSPAELLSSLNRSVKETLRTGNEAHEHEARTGLISKTIVQDGMDLALLSFDPAKRKLVYAGANRPLWIFNAKKEWREYKPTKAAIGGHIGINQQYEQEEVSLSPGDTLYLFTDGFADQFGGPEGKKIMTRRLRDWLTELQALSMDGQRQELDTRFANWKGNNEQVDDVLVIGIRI